MDEAIWVLPRATKLPIDISECNRQIADNKWTDHGQKADIVSDNLLLKPLDEKVEQPIVCAKTDFVSQAVEVFSNAFRLGAKKIRNLISVHTSGI